MTPDRPSDEGDYGYDMAHEATGQQGAPHRAPDPAHPGGSPATPDPGGDYGYDEAHGY
jgi:hypothetical protein